MASLLPDVVPSYPGVGLGSFNSVISQLARDIPPLYVSVCRAVNSRLVQIQPEDRLVGAGALVLGARRISTVPCPPTGVAHIRVVPRRCRCSLGSQREVGKTAGNVGGVEWLRHEHRLLRKQSCLDGSYPATPSLGLVLLCLTSLILT